MHLAMRRTQIRANRALALVSHLFSTAEQWGLRRSGSHPSRHIKRYRENRRERFLSNTELARLGATLTSLDRQQVARNGQRDASAFAIAAIRVALFTGARASEVLSLRWNEVRLDTGMARLPDSKTGRRTLFLNPPALAVLNALPRIEGSDFVIVGRKPGQHLTLWGLERAWQRIRRLAKLDDVRLHDLRHSFASIGAASGDSLLVIGTLLGHTRIGTTQRYAHLSNDPVRAAAARIGQRIQSAMGSGAVPSDGPVQATSGIEQPTKVRSGR